MQDFLISFHESFVLSFGYNKINKMCINKENSQLKVKIPSKPEKTAKKQKARVNYEPLQKPIEAVNAETMNVTEAWKVLSIPRQTLND